MTNLSIISSPAPRNHNNPPSDMEILGEQLTIRHVSLIREGEGHIEIIKMMPPKFGNQLDADYVSDLIKKMQDCLKNLESAREVEKKPFWDMGKYVDGFFGTEKEKLTTAIELAKKPLGEWLNAQAAEEKKRREAEAAQLTLQAEVSRIDAIVEPTIENASKVEATEHVAEVARQVAAAPIVSMASAGGKISKAGLKKEWVGTIVDLNKLDLEKLRPYIKIDALQVALNSFVKVGGRECAGAKISEETKTSVR